MINKYPFISNCRLIIEQISAFYKNVSHKRNANFHETLKAQTLEILAGKKVTRALNTNELKTKQNSPGMSSIMLSRVRNPNSCVVVTRTHRPPAPARLTAGHLTWHPHTKLPLFTTNPRGPTLPFTCPYYSTPQKGARNHGHRSKRSGHRIELYTTVWPHAISTNKPASPSRIIGKFNLANCHKVTSF